MEDVVQYILANAKALTYVSRRPWRCSLDDDWSRGLANHHTQEFHSSYDRYCPTTRALCDLLCYCCCRFLLSVAIAGCSYYSFLFPWNRECRSSSLRRASRLLPPVHNPQHLSGTCYNHTLPRLLCSLKSICVSYLDYGAIQNVDGRVCERWIRFHSGIFWSHPLKTSRHSSILCMCQMVTKRGKTKG